MAATAALCEPEFAQTDWPLLCGSDLWCLSSKHHHLTSVPSTTTWSAFGRTIDPVPPRLRDAKTIKMGNAIRRKVHFEEEQEHQNVNDKQQSSLSEEIEENDDGVEHEHV